MQTLSSFKRGDTFSFIAAIANSSGTPLTGEASNLSSQIRNKSDKLYATLTITETTTLGSYLFLTNDTLDWPCGVDLYLDIQYTKGGVITSSETIIIPVEKDVTHSG
jgi:hypothetical protein